MKKLAFWLVLTFTFSLSLFSGEGFEVGAEPGKPLESPELQAKEKELEKTQEEIKKTQKQINDEQVRIEDFKTTISREKPGTRARVLAKGSLDFAQQRQSQAQEELEQLLKKQKTLQTDIEQLKQKLEKQTKIEGQQFEAATPPKTEEPGQLPELTRTQKAFTIFRQKVSDIWDTIAFEIRNFFDLADTKGIIQSYTKANETLTKLENQPTNPDYRRAQQLLERYKNQLVRTFPKKALDSILEEFEIAQGDIESNLEFLETPKKPLSTEIQAKVIEEINNNKKEILDLIETQKQKFTQRLYQDIFKTSQDENQQAYGQAYVNRNNELVQAITERVEKYTNALKKQIEDIKIPGQQAVQTSKDIP